MEGEDYFIRAVDSIEQSGFILKRTYFGKMTGHKYYVLRCQQGHSLVLSATNIKHRTIPIECGICVFRKHQ
jgi:hypothetical protein